MIATARRAFWLIPLSFYLLTGSRTPGWADASLIARTVHNLDFHVWVNSHNLFTLVGAAWMRLLPDSVEPHYALSLLCALLGAMTVQVVFSIGIRLTDNTFASALGALALMVSHSLWWHSTMLEVYTLSSFLLALIVLLVLRYEQTENLRNLYGAVFCFGLGCSNHAQMGLLLFGFLGLLVWPDLRKRLLRPRTGALLGISFLLGFQLYLWVFASGLFERLGDAQGGAQGLASVLGTMLDETTGGEFRRYMFPAGLSLSERLFWWLFYGGFFVYSFPSPALLFGAIGGWAWIRKQEHRATLVFFAVSFLAQLIWSANYFVWDMYAFALPVYTLFGVLVIVGIDWTYRRSRPFRFAVYCVAPTLLLPGLLYSKTPEWIAANDRAIQLLQTLPQYGQAKAFWDPLDYFFNPNKSSYDRVSRYSQTVLGELEPRACYWGDEAKLFYPLKYYYQDVLGQRRDVRYELIFGMLGNHQEFRTHAMRMAQQLKRGCPLYVASLGYPERDVLNYVYTLFDPRSPLGRVAALPQDAFMETFPNYRFEAIELDRPEGVRIFRMTER